MIEKTEKQIAQEIRDILKGPLAQMFFFVANHDDMAIACEHYPEVDAILGFYAERHADGIPITQSVRDRVSARAASRAAAAAIDEVLRNPHKTNTGTS